MQKYEAADYSDDDAEASGGVRRARSPPPPPSSEESDVDGELVYDLAKMEELWKEDEDMLLKSHFHQLKGNTKQRCEELERILTEENEGDALTKKTAKDIKFRLAMLNIKRVKPKKKERKFAKRSYPGASVRMTF